MATLTAQSPALTGTTPTYAAASAGGDQLAADGNTFLVVKNGGGSTCNVTAVTTRTIRNLAVADLTVAVPAGGERWIGPFAYEDFANGSGRVAITYDQVTSVTVAAVSA